MQTLYGAEPKLQVKNYYFTEKNFGNYKQTVTQVHYSKKVIS